MTATPEHYSPTTDNSHGNQPTMAVGPARAKAPTYSARKMRWLLWKPVVELTDVEARYVATLKELCPQIAQTQDLLLAFRTLVTEPYPGQVDHWLDQCLASVAGPTIVLSKPLLFRQARE